MTNYSVDGSKVLIVSGYTQQELLLKANKKTSKQVKTPPSFFFNAKNISVQLHRPNYEEFESADGLIAQETACDAYAQIDMEIYVYQRLTNIKGEFVINSTNREVKVITTDTNIDVIDEELQLGRYIRPDEFPDEYVAVRNNFFKDLLGRPLTIVSQLFDPLEYCRIADNYTYNINEGEQEATYSVTFKEYATLK